MDKLTFSGKIDGIAVEQIVRFGEFNMKVKHFHSQYEIFYIVEGQRQFFFNNRYYTAVAGDLILIDTNLIHMTTSSNTNGYNRIIFYIDYDEMAKFDNQYPALGIIEFFHNNYGIYHLNDEQQSSFLNLYRQVRLLIADKTSGFSTGVEINVLQWLFGISRELKNDSTMTLHAVDDTKHNTVYKIADYITKNHTRNISLEELSDKFFMSKYYICRIFKEVTNYTLTEYVNIHRIQNAQKLLENTNKSISEIADLLGFESLTYFEKIFKTYMNISPLKYRKTRDAISINADGINILDDTSYLLREH